MRQYLQPKVAGKIAVIAALYIVAARVGLTIDTISGFATLVWPPTGIALASLLLGGSALWPGVFIGAVLANVLTGAPLLVATGIGIGNTRLGRPHRGANYDGSAAGIWDHQWRSGTWFNCQFWTGKSFAERKTCSTKKSNYRCRH